MVAANAIAAMLHGTSPAIAIAAMFLLLAFVQIAVLFIWSFVVFVVANTFATQIEQHFRILKLNFVSLRCA